MPSKQDEYIVRSFEPNIEIPDCSLGQFLQETITKVDPNKVMMINVETEQQQTYGELNQIALELADGLLKLGLKSTDSVMFYAENSIDCFDLYVALTYLGLVYSPSKSANGRYETEQQLNDLQATVLVISPDKLAVVRQMLTDEQKSISMLKLLVVLEIGNDEITNLKDYVEIVKHPNRPPLITTFEQLLPGPGQLNNRTISSVPHFQVKSPSTNPSLIVYTSGTTGQPKGAVHSHRSFIAALLNYSQVESFQQCFGGTVSNCYPFGHVSGTVFTATFLCYQMTILIYPYQRIETDVLLRSIEKYRVSMMPILQNIGIDIFEYDYRLKYDLSSIKLIWYCGSKYSQNIVDTIEKRYCRWLDDLYGATEFMASGFNRDGGRHPFGCLGSPSANNTMKIVDRVTGQSLPSNQKGEICFRGPNCFLGYWNNRQATAETIDTDGWYHSGDVGYYDEQMRLFFADRIKELVKYKHWSVEPAEVETFLHLHPSVSGACVIGVPHQTEGCHLRAYVCLFKGKQTTQQELMEYVKENMGYQKRLNAGVQFVSEIPRNLMGKVDRKYFKNLVKDQLLIEPASVY